MEQKTAAGEFKTSLLGFSKGQVLAYIDGMTAKALEEKNQAEAAAAQLQKQLEGQKADNALLVEKTKEVCDRLADAEKRADEAESRTRAVSEQLLHMEQTANGYKSRLFTKEQEALVLGRDNARLTEQLAQLTKQLDEARAEGEKQARDSREQLARQAADLEARQAAERRQLEQDQAAARRQLELEKARFDQTRRTQRDAARRSAQQMADTVLLLRSQLDEVDRQIAQAARQLKTATSAVYEALGETEKELEGLGAQAKSYPDPLPEAEKPAADTAGRGPAPRRAGRPPRPLPPRRRTLSEGLLEALERALADRR